MESINESVGPFRSELAAKMYRETFMIAQGPHSHTLSATVRGNLGGWFVDTTRQPEGVAA